MENRYRSAASMKGTKQQRTVNKETWSWPAVANGGSKVGVAKQGVANTMSTQKSDPHTRACDCKARFYDLQKAYEKVQQEKETRYDALKEMYDKQSQELDLLSHKYMLLKEYNLYLKKANTQRIAALEADLRLAVNSASEVLIFTNWLLKQNEEITAGDNTLIRKACENLEQTLSNVSF